MNYLTCFETIAGFCGIVVIITQFIKDTFKITNDKLQQWISWFVGIALGCIGFATQTGLFQEFGTPDMWQGWLITVIASFFMSLASNGVFDIKTVQAIIKWVESLLKIKK